MHWSVSDRPEIYAFSLKLRLWSHNCVQVGKLADLVIWKPAFFGAKPEMVIKGGTIAWADMGDPNASIPTPEPVIQIFHPLYKPNLMFPT